MVELVLGGHPSIVPLVAMVAGEYTHKLDRNLSIYGGIRQRRYPEIERIHSLMCFNPERLSDISHQRTSAICKAGLANIHWIESLNGEMFDPSKLGEPQCESSLRVMRETLLNFSQSRQRLVGMGGMEGLLEEFTNVLGIFAVDLCISFDQLGGWHELYPTGFRNLIPAISPRRNRSPIYATSTLLA